MPINFLVQFAIMAALTLISALLMPKPKVSQAQPGEIHDSDVPIATADAPIPVLFGTRLMKAPNVVWYGAVRTVPIQNQGGKK